MALLMGALLAVTGQNKSTWHQRNCRVFVVIVPQKARAHHVCSWNRFVSRDPLFVPMFLDVSFVRFLLHFVVVLGAWPLLADQYGVVFQGNQNCNYQLHAPTSLRLFTQERSGEAKKSRIVKFRKGAACSIAVTCMFVEGAAYRPECFGNAITCRPPIAGYNPQPSEEKVESALK